MTIHSVRATDFDSIIDTIHTTELGRLIVTLNTPHPARITSDIEDPHSIHRVTIGPAELTIRTTTRSVGYMTMVDPSTWEILFETPDTTIPTQIHYRR